MQNLHPGFKFAPRVHFWPCERCFKNLHPGANAGCKCAPIFEVQFVHMNAK